MEIVIPPRDHGKATFRYTWDKDGTVRNLEALERIQEGDEPESAPEDIRPTTAKTGTTRRVRNSMAAWPFHRATTSNVTSIPITSNFRRPTWQPKSFFKTSDDSASTYSRSIVPDYVVNYIRGETPETLARRKEQRNWGERNVMITPKRETFYSRAAEFEDPFASTTDLSPNGPSENRYDNEWRQRGLRRFLEGWRAGVVFNILLSTLIFLVALVCFAVAVSKAKSISEIAIFTGSCSMTSNINIGTHIVINVCAIVLLAGANYIFQVLSSPTRLEVVAAHKNKRWLDVGIPSIRNLLQVSGFRSSLAIVVILVAVATHVIYNAVISTSRTGLDYDVVFVTETFLSGAPFSNATNNEGGLSRLELLALQDAASQKDLVNLTTTTCLQEFGGAFETSFDAVMLVIDIDVTNSSLVQIDKPGTSLHVYSTNSNDDDDIMALDGSAVLYCLAREGSAPQTCAVNANILMLGIVALLNLVTLFIMAVVLTRSSLEPLVTLGDALRSFLRNADVTTDNNCLLTKTDVSRGRWNLREAKYFIPKPHWWISTPSASRWFLFMFSWLLITAPATVALAVLLMAANPSAGLPLLTAFGTATPHTTFLLPSPVSTDQMALLSAAPQLLLAILYLTTNSLLTTYWLSHELSLFSVSPRPLRVSADRVGAQTTSLYLTLPRPVSWFLLMLFATMGYVLSQAVFPAIIDITPASSSTTPSSTSDRTTAISLSTQALLALVALLLVLAMTVISLGFRQAPSASGDSVEKGNPLALRGGSCSAVLSAKCHTDLSEVDHDIWRKQISWGVVGEGLNIEVGHCAFSAVGVGAVDGGRLYA
ncbi:uncharacterized protein BCR38DRAFT_464055 [Pseudomassariella vexata]|uniref:DUF6536 domain-containing protein n=1 Tax=Pseudomassariella vexata TaxID=1141098 RepID=A0A1Y2EAT4_9PEZI|nr:uncharacterized protein BCR38DRAFT_464055 [Pseudomassariella vexata]ORY68683.1 hypothetical protein BCR38DRAFT_464055 [Pseudomassariella vexata]